MAGLESNKIKMQGKNTIFGKTSMVRRNKGTVNGGKEGHCSTELPVAGDEGGGVLVRR